MEIRLVNKKDDCFAISHVYEEIRKIAYKDIIPQIYLNSIPKGYWAQIINDSAWNTLVMLDCHKIIGTTSYCTSRIARHFV